MRTLTVQRHRFSYILYNLSYRRLQSLLSLAFFFLFTDYSLRFSICQYIIFRFVTLYKNHTDDSWFIHFIINRLFRFPPFSSLEDVFYSNSGCSLPPSLRPTIPQGLWSGSPFPVKLLPTYNACGAFQGSAYPTDRHLWNHPGRDIPSCIGWAVFHTPRVNGCRRGRDNYAHE